MSATATYGDLLKRYTPEKLIENTFAKYNLLWTECSKDKSWRGGTREVPLHESGFSSVQFGSLAAATDIGEMKVAMGTATMKELWGSVLVRESDLYRHGDMEQSYLKIMPEKLEEFVKFMGTQVSVSFLNGGRTATATANGQATDGIVVDKIYMFRINQKVEVDDDNSNATTGYVRTINLNTKTIVLYDARTGGAVVDLSAYTTAQNAIVRIVGTGSETFTGLPTYIFPAAVSGGSASAYGLTKADYTVLQSLYASGAAFTQATILDDLLTKYYEWSEIRGDVFSNVYVSYGVFKNIAKILENNRAYVTGDKKAGYGWNSIDIVGADGMAKIVALREMPNDKIYFGDFKNVEFSGAEPFKRKLYDNKEFFLIRNITGPEMVSDYALRGEFIVKPNQWAGVYSLAAECYA